MTEQDVQTWLDHYGTAWVDGDPQLVAALFTEDAQYRETPFDTPMAGRGDIIRYWQDGAADAQENVTFSARVWAVDGTSAIAGWQATFTRKATGARVRLDGVFRLHFARDGDAWLCTRLEEWWHRQEA